MWHSGQSQKTAHIADLTWETSLGPAELYIVRYDALGSLSEEGNISRSCLAVPHDLSLRSLCYWLNITIEAYLIAIPQIKKIFVRKAFALKVGAIKGASIRSLKGKYRAERYELSSCHCGNPTFPLEYSFLGLISGSRSNQGHIGRRDWPEGAQRLFSDSPCETDTRPPAQTRTCMVETREPVVLKLPPRVGGDQSGWAIPDQSQCLIARSGKQSDEGSGYKWLTRKFVILSHCSWFAGNISRAQSEQLLRQKVSRPVFKGSLWGP